MLFFNVRVVFSSILQGVRALPIFPHQPSPTQLLQVETTGRFIAALACINAVSSLPLWSAAMTHEGSAVWKYAAGQLKSRSVETISGFCLLRVAVKWKAHWQLRTQRLSVWIWRTLIPQCHIKCAANCTRLSDIRTRETRDLLLVEASISACGSWGVFALWGKLSCQWLNQFALRSLVQPSKL